MFIKRAVNKYCNLMWCNALVAFGLFFFLGLYSDFCIKNVLYSTFKSGVTGLINFYSRLSEKKTAKIKVYSNTIV